MSQVVARLGKPHGIRGEVTAEVRTDDPEARFVPEARFATEPDIGTLTLTRARRHQNRLLLSFAEVTDRNRAEEIRNTLITVDDDAAGADDDAWYLDDLVGAKVYLVGAARASGQAVTRDAAPEGLPLGRVSDVTTGAAQDLLHISLENGGEALIPFVEQIVPVVDPEAGYIEIDPPVGLLDLGQE